MVWLRKISFVALIVTLAPLSVQAGAAGVRSKLPFDRLVVFGDSLSDPGNAYVKSGVFLVPPFEDGVPDAPYAMGRFHFSNGATWIEWLARDLRLVRSARPALLRPGVFSNYAIGAARPDPGARARDEAGPPNLGSEIALFLEDFDNSAPSGALYVIWIGANDLFDALQAPDEAEATAIVSEALGATAASILTLYGHGARSFLVLNLPDLSITPQINTLPAPIPDQVSALSQAYDAALDEVLESLMALPGIVIARMDVFTILNNAVDNPESVGLTNVTDSCITPGVVAGAICRHPHTYLFWDSIHPTTQAHRLLSERARDVLDEAFGNVQSVAEAADAMIGAR